MRFDVFLSQLISYSTFFVTFAKLFPTFLLHFLKIALFRKIAVCLISL